MLLLKHHCLFCLNKLHLNIFPYICSHSNYEKDMYL